MFSWLRISEVSGLHKFTHLPRPSLDAPLILCLFTKNLTIRVDLELKIEAIGEGKHPGFTKSLTFGFH